MRDAVEREIQIYTLPDGNAPFEAWISSLRDKRARARIFTRIDRIRLGNFGDCRSVGGGVYEIRMPYGPGYRVYFGLLSQSIVLLLCGGVKKTQAHDIEIAHSYWKEIKKDADKTLR